MKIFALVLAVGVLIQSSAGAAQAEHDLAADASAFVRARNERLAASADISSASRMGLVGMKRFYRPGDSWIVAISHTYHPMVSKSANDKARGKSRELQAEYFGFRVLSLNAAGNEAQVEVKRVPGPTGEKAPGGRINSVLLTMTDSLVIRSKKISVRSLATEISSETASDDNLTTGTMSFPVELPSFSLGKIAVQGDSYSPPLRAALRKAALHKEFRSDSSTRLHSADLFSRPVELIWKHGDLWPAFIQTQSSQTVLVSQTLQ